MSAALESPATGIAVEPTAVTAQGLFDAAFGVPRIARSEPYQRGALDILRAKFGRYRLAAIPYIDGTPEADAYWAGMEEGRVLYREHQAAEHTARTALAFGAVMTAVDAQSFELPKAAR